MNVSTEVIAYLAGVMDSDGYIGVQRNTYAMRVRGDATQAIYQARTQVKQVEPAAIDLFRQAFGGHRFLQGPSAAQGRQLWTWQVHSAACRPILETLLPFLRIKRAQAENALEVCRLSSMPKRFVLPKVIEGEPLITIAEAAERLGKPYSIIHQAVYKGSIPIVRKPRAGPRAPTVFIPESYLATWANRGRTPKRSAEVTAQLEACFQRAKELNRVGV
jgi:hypothetical protein